MSALKPCLDDAEAREMRVGLCLKLTTNATGGCQRSSGFRDSIDVDEALETALGRS